MPTLAISDITTTPGAFAKYAVSVTPQLSAGRNFVGRSSYRDLVTFDSEDELPFDLTPYYTARFGALVAGKKVFVRVQLVTATGLRSGAVEVPAIIA